MESLSRVLLPYKELIGAVAGIVTVGQMFSGSFLCYDMYKQKGTGGIGVTPFIGGLVMSLLNLRFGYLIRDDTMIRVNFIGIAINVVYLMIYFHYAQSKVRVWAQLGLSGAFSAAVIGYSNTEDPKLVEHRFGLIITVLMFTLIASPLFGLKDIIRNKSTEGMPFPIILSGSVVTFMWLLYGIVLKNNFIVIQNVVALSLCGAQLLLFVIYPSKPSPPARAQKSRKAE